MHACVWQDVIVCHTLAFLSIDRFVCMRRACNDAQPTAIRMCSKSTVWTLVRALFVHNATAELVTLQPANESSYTAHAGGQKTSMDTERQHTSMHSAILCILIYTKMSYWDRYANMYTLFVCAYMHSIRMKCIYRGAAAVIASVWFETFDRTDHTSVQSSNTHNFPIGVLCHTRAYSVCLKKFWYWRCAVSVWDRPQAKLKPTTEE